MTTDLFPMSVSELGPDVHQDSRRGLGSRRRGQSAPGRELSPQRALSATSLRAQRPRGRRAPLLLLTAAAGFLLLLGWKWWWVSDDGKSCRSVSSERITGMSRAVGLPTVPSYLHAWTSGEVDGTYCTGGVGRDVTV
jgi:hypothetical protein